MTAAPTEQPTIIERAQAMFAALLIAGDDRRHALIREAALETGEVLFLRLPVGYPNARDLTNVMNHVEPELVILDLSNPAQAADCAQCIWERFPKTVVVGVGSRNLGEMVHGVPFPPTAQQLRRAIHRGMHSVRGSRGPGLFAFLPAKAGCGASTVALNAAGAWAEEGKRVLLIDADLHSGALGAMVKTNDGYSLQQVLRGISELDKFRLEQAVSHAIGFDLLLSDGTPVMPVPNWPDYFRLIDIARTRYDMIVADLPEVVNQATQEFVQRAQNVFVVLTQESVPVRLLPRRFEELAAWGVNTENVRVVVNRWQRGDMGLEEIEKRTGRSVDHTVPNGYRFVRRAIDDGQLVAKSSPPGEAYRALARRAIGGEEKRGLLAQLFGG